MTGFEAIPDVNPSTARAWSSQTKLRRNCVCLGLAKIAQPL
ncbi:hypothetical protein I552_0408 [Mycobacterium xenopi 3993]|nr:hypothetical protein I552_9785 [Mycobacterium xenopi 3993]EUA54852.1 hypothetical protein I552_0408 [Mycobacterium xenopi 3993]